MKIYLLYLLPKQKLYAVTNNKKYLDRFLEERNSKLFKVKIKKVDEGDVSILKNNKQLNLDIIPLENDNGDCNIIGTYYEDHILSNVCDKMSETCENFKFHFTQNVGFKDEYKHLLINLTTVSKNINNHPIIQIDTVKLFYYLFKDTFIYQDNDDDDYETKNEFIEKYKNL